MSSTETLTPAAELEMASPKKARMSTRIADLLAVWQYAEYGAMRVLTGWGRAAGHWDDKLAVCYHTWLQAESTDKLRDRLEMFPGNPDTPVSGRYETALNTLFLAPSWADAMGALHEILYPALTTAYEAYIAGSHPVHDKPTHDILREIIAAKTPQMEWYGFFRTRDHFEIDPDYAARARAALAGVEWFQEPLSAVAPFAAPVGKNTDFRMKAAPGKVPGGDMAPNIMPLIESDWCHSVETRRLFFMIGYFWEMGVAEGQLRWLYYADFMPWEFIRDEARHMWDESRHGNSGLSRLRDFGLDIQDVGYSSYGQVNQEGELAPMTPKDVYEAFYSVTQIAETGYFKTKGYCFEDFRDGGDAASAEMMQFDIIDETLHTEYGRKWLDIMQERAGVQEDYRARGVKDRQAAFERSGARVAIFQRFLETGELPDDPAAWARGKGETGQSVLPGDAASLAKSCLYLRDEKARKHYEWLLQVVREQCPLSNAETAPVRPQLPM